MENNFRTRLFILNESKTKVVGVQKVYSPVTYEEGEVITLGMNPEKPKQYYEVVSVGELVLWIDQSIQDYFVVPFKKTFEVQFSKNNSSFIETTLTFNGPISLYYQLPIDRNDSENAPIVTEIIEPNQFTTYRITSEEEKVETVKYIIGEEITD